MNSGTYRHRWERWRRSLVLRLVRQHRRRFLLALVLLAAALPLLISLSRGAAGTVPEAQAAAGPTPPSKAELPAGYIGSKACARCHSQIYESYMKTDMARSVSVVSPELLKTFHLPATYYNPHSGRHYEVYERDGKLFQSQYELDASGKPIFHDTHQVRWIIGAGASVYGGIITRGQYLFEAPMAFYTRSRSWGLEPGYEANDIGFNRPILAGCIACHSGWTNPIPGTNAKYAAPVFSEMNIGCERCHGPGAAHVAAMTKGEIARGDRAIVNPAHLSPELANSLCESCHELGDERIARPGKQFQHYLPGTPLANTFSILMVPPTPGHPPTSDHLEQYYEMTLSKPYRATSGQFRCIDCHDPHFEPAAQQARAYFNAKCVTCHTHPDCTEPIAIRSKTNPPNNCIACHMPQRSAVVIEHDSLTDHLIPMRPGQPFPDAAYHQTTPELPDLVNLTPVPGHGNAPPPLLTLLQAYGDLSSYRPEYVAPYLRVLDQLSRSDAENELVQAALGRKALVARNYPEAAIHLRKALTIGPPQAVVYGDLANAEYHLGNKGESVSLLRKGIRQDPYNPVLRKQLVRVLLAMKQDAEAQQSLQRYLEIFPQDSSMRALESNARPGAR